MRSAGGSEACDGLSRVRERPVGLFCENVGLLLAPTFFVAEPVRELPDLFVEKRCG